MSTMPTITMQSSEAQHPPVPTTEPVQVPDQPSARTSSDRNESKKRALLIGVRGDLSESSLRLKGPHNDVRMWHDLLLEKYSYLSENITVLIDDDSLGDESQPTVHNILKAIAQLVADASAGDRLLFLFSGHSSQSPSEVDDDDEEDELDEYIETSDGGRIKDNVLYERLVLPLPPKCKLTAIVDSCHSGTILDLKHHRCNRVFVPWLNKGPRRTMTLWNQTVRKPALVIPGEVRKPSRGSPESSIIISSAQNSSGSGVQRSSTKLKINTDFIASEAPLIVSPTAVCSSPIQRFCDGNCTLQDGENEPKADVICISSCLDNELTWEDPDGKSMIHWIVDLLKKNQYPLLCDLMTDISHNVHQHYLELHSKSLAFKKRYAEHQEKQREKKRRRLGKRGRQEGSGSADTLSGSALGLVLPFLETTNFQTPVLSSMTPRYINDRHLSL